MKNIIGTAIEQYQILVRIRETGTRVLYKAHDPRTRKQIALEIVKIPCADNAALLKLLDEQAKKNAVLTHPNIARMTDSGIHDGSIFLVYDFHPLRPLRRFFNRTYSWQEMARELVSITQAAAYAHEAGICHGAINPTSIILDDKKSPILFDFGFEQIIRDFTLAHAPGAWIGKWGYEYCAPEQLNGAPPDARSDVYAMGMILHEWISGEVALLEPTPLDTLRKRLFTRAEDEKQNREIPPAIQNLIEKCITMNPAERYQSMQEVGLILARGALDLTITKSMVRKPLSIPSTRPTRKRAWIGLGLLAALIILAGSVLGAGSGFLSSMGGGNRETAALPATTSSKTLRPTSTPAPTKTTIPSPTVFASAPITADDSLIYPLFQGTPIASTNRTLESNNANQIVPISIWGLGDLNDLTVSADGKRLAAGSSRGIFILDADTLSLERYIDTYSWISAIKFSPDGRLIAAGDKDGLIRLWATDTWQEVTKTTFSGHTKGVFDLAFSPDGTRLASVGLDNNLFQWQINPADTSRPAPVQVTGVTRVAYSSDGERVITGDDLFKIIIWDAGNLTLVRSITFPSKVVDIAAFEDPRFILVGGADRRVTLVDIEGEAGINTLGTLQYPLSGIAASADGKMFAGGDINGRITVWTREGESWKAQETISKDPLQRPLGSTHSLTFSPDGGALYSGLQNGTLRSLDALTGQEIRQNQSLDAHVSRFTLSNDGRYMITQHDDSIVKVWDVRKGGLLYQLQGEIKMGNPFSQDDRYIAIASEPSVVKVFLSINGDDVHTFNGHERIETIRFIRNDTQLAVGHHQALHLWSMISGQEMKTARNFSGSGCSNFFDLKDTPLVSVTSYHHMFEFGANSSMWCNFQKVNWMEAFQVNETNASLAYGGNSQLYVQFANSKHAMDGVNLHNVVSVTISPDGGLLAAAYDDSTIHLWDVATRQEVMSLFGHSGPVTDLRFVPNGSLLISASLDGTIRLWGIPE